MATAQGPTGAPIEGEVLTPDELKRREARVREKFWRKLRGVARRIPFTEDLLAAYYCAFDPKTPLRVKATLLGALAYFIMPVDLVPDMLLGLGFTDDAAVLAIAIKMVASNILPTHRDAARGALDDRLLDGSDAREI